MRRLLPALLLVATACAGQDAPPASTKPLPPIDLAAQAVDLGGGRWRVSVTTSPLVDAASFGAELVLPAGARLAGGDGRRALVAAHPGDHADFTAEVEAPAGSELLLSTRIRLPDGLEGGRTLRVFLGPRPARPVRTLARPRRIVHTPAGDVAEVAP